MLSEELNEKNEDARVLIARGRWAMSEARRLQGEAKRLVLEAAAANAASAAHFQSARRAALALESLARAAGLGDRLDAVLRELEAGPP